MNRYPGLGPEHAMSDAFWSDANLDLRAKPVSYSDIAPGPNELMSDAVGGSGILQGMQSSGAPLVPLQLAELEVDGGGRSADSTVSHPFMSNQSAPLPQPYPPAFTPNPPPPAPPAPAVSEASIERIADLVIARIEKKLSGGNQ